MSKIKVIICRVGQNPVVEEIESGLTAMQEIVGGYIECVQLDGDSFSHGIDLWCNEEGLFTCQPNRLVNHTRINGDCFIAAHNGEGDTVGLTDKEAQHYLNVARGWPMAISSLA